MKFWKGHWQLIVIVALVFACWGLPVIYPLKLLVVFLHEASHALAALVTGGTVQRISLSPEEGGLAITSGGNGFIIASAGYLGSLFFGVTFFAVALRSKMDRSAMGALGVFIILICGLYVRESFPLWFGMLTGIALLACGLFLGSRANDFLLRIIGLTSMIYVPWDIFSDTLLRSEMNSDARIIAERYGGATVIWGGLWLVASGVTILLCLKFCLKRNSNIRLG